MPLVAESQIGDCDHRLPVPHYVLGFAIVAQNVRAHAVEALVVTATSKFIPMPEAENFSGRLEIPNSSRNEKKWTLHCTACVLIRILSRTLRLHDTKNGPVNRGWRFVNSPVCSDSGKKSKNVYRKASFIG